MLIAERRGEAVGFVCCRAARDADPLIHDAARRYGYIADVYVEAAHRGRGVGGALIAAAERHLAGLGMGRLRVSALAANADACAVYRRRGYTAYEITFEKPLGGKPR